MKTLPMINMEQIQSLKELSEPGEPSLLLELVEMFTNQGDQTIDHLNDALKEQNIISLGKYAHKLKGSAANLGADLLKHQCQTLETMSQEQSLDGAEEVYQDIVNTYIQLKKELNVLLDAEK